MDKTPNKSQSSLLGIFINILLPVLILDYCSAGPANPLERPEGENFWHIGPVWALVIALSLPPLSMVSVPWSSPGNLT